MNYRRRTRRQRFSARPTDEVSTRRSGRQTLNATAFRPTRLANAVVLRVVIACNSSKIIGLILWGHSGPLCHALSLLSLLLLMSL